MIIYIEGNIGSGKSTFISELQKYIDKNCKYAEILQEPVDQWVKLKDSKGKNVLEHYYSDSKKYAFAFQMNAFISRVKDIVDYQTRFPNKIIFVERSVYTDKNVFCHMNYLNGNISEMEYMIYNQWFDFYSKHFNLNPEGYVYLKTDYKECLERIKKRDRNGEESIPIEYLKSLEEFHDKWLESEEKNDIDLMNIDGNINYLKEKDELQKVFASLFNFVKIAKQSRSNKRVKWLTGC